MNISVNYLNNNMYNANQTSFKSRMFDIQALQNIKGIPCACCGKKVISPEDVAHTFAKISRPLSESISKGFLDMWKSVPNIWAILNNFAQKYPKDSFDAIVQRDDDDFHNIRGAVSADARKENPDVENRYINHLAKNAYVDILYSSRTELEAAEKVMDKFSQFKKYMSGKPLEAFETLQIYAQKYPDKRLAEIINLPEVYEFHKTRKELNDKKQNEKLNFHFKNIIKIIKSEDPLSVLCFKKNEIAVHDILHKYKDLVARKEAIKNLYINRLDFMKCNNVSKQVLAEVAQFPDFRRTEDDFFVYAHDNNYSDAMIIRSLISPFMGTFEHVIPKVYSGSDSIYNGIVMCAGCNHSRGTYPYSKFIEYHPEMKKNTQKQIDYVIRQILTDKVNDVTISRWPIVITRALKMYTNEEIKPEIADYTDYAIKFISDKYASDKAEIEKLNDLISDIRSEKTKLEERLKNLEIKEKEYSEQVEKISKDNSSREYDLNFLERISSGSIEPTMNHAHEKIGLPEEHQQFSDDFCSDGG